MSEKGCELCSNPARMFCESDQASLCWDCDEEVHSANFLVAKHSRTLLCHVCYSPTAWKAAGLKLRPAVSVCHACAEIGLNLPAPIECGQDICDNSQESESDDGEYNSDADADTDCSEEEEDDGENQVVPWAEDAAAAISTAASASTSEDDEEEEAPLKRMRENPVDSEDEDGCCSSQNSESKLCDAASDRIISFQSQSDDNNGSSSSSLLRPLKMRRIGNNSDGPSISPEQSQMKSLKGTAAIVDQLRRLQQEILTEEGKASTMILGICKVTREA